MSEHQTIIMWLVQSDFRHHCRNSGNFDGARCASMAFDATLAISATNHRYGADGAMNFDQELDMGITENIPRFEKQKFPREWKHCACVVQCTSILCEKLITNCQVSMRLSINLSTEGPIGNTTSE